MSVNAVPMNEAELATLHAALRRVSGIGKHPAEDLAERTGYAVAARTIGRASAGEPVQRATVAVLLATCEAVNAEEAKRAA